MLRAEKAAINYKYKLKAGGRERRKCKKKKTHLSPAVKALFISSGPATAAVAETTTTLSILLNDFLSGDFQNSFLEITPLQSL